jgi:probable HAF family extracellular repeat protein
MHHRNPIRTPVAALPMLFLAGAFAAGTCQAQKYTVTKLSPLPGDIATSASGMNNAGQVAGDSFDSNGEFPGGGMGKCHAVRAHLRPLPRGRLGGSCHQQPRCRHRRRLRHGTWGVRDRAERVYRPGFTTTGLAWGRSAMPTSSSVTFKVIHGCGREWTCRRVRMAVSDHRWQLRRPRAAQRHQCCRRRRWHRVRLAPRPQRHLSVAVRWKPDPSTHAPGATVKALGGLGGRTSAANAINSNGWIVGWASLGNKLQHAALWEPTTGAFDLGTLGGKQSYANAINAEGDIAGNAQTASGAWHAVLWTHKHFTATDLNLEISPSLGQANHADLGIGYQRSLHGACQWCRQQERCPRIVCLVADRSVSMQPALSGRLRSRA